MKYITYYEVHVYINYALSDTECLARFQYLEDAEAFRNLRISYDEITGDPAMIHSVVQGVFTSLDEALNSGEYSE